MASRVLIGALVVTGPVLLTSALLAALFRASLLDYFPLVSDELAYYQQIATYVRAGFNGGYFTNSEMPAPLAFTHFSVHGPAFPVIYGSLGRLFGWTPRSGPIFNHLVLAVATSFFLTVSRLSRRQMIATGLVMLTSWWVILMASITMQESLNQAMLVVVAALAAKMLHAGTSRPGIWLAATLAVLVVASILRPTNWIVAIPVAFAGLARRGVRPALLAAVAAALGVPVFWLVWRYISAPIPDLPLDLAGLSASGLASRLVERVGNQTTRNLALFEVRAFVSQPFFQHVMFESAALAAAFGLMVGAAVWRAWAARPSPRTQSEIWGSQAFRTDVFVMLTLWGGLAAFVGMYEDAESSLSRVMAPFLLLSLLILVATNSRPRVVALIVLVNLLVAPSSLSAYRGWRAGLFTYDGKRFALFRNQIEPYITFDSTQGGWCNTLLTMSYEREIVAVPPGIGLSVGSRVDAIATPVRSKYLLLSVQGAKIYATKTTLQHVANTELGELYVNRDSGCR